MDLPGADLYAGIRSQGSVRLQHSARRVWHSLGLGDDLHVDVHAWRFPAYRRKQGLLYLWIFGNNVEDAMGHTRYLFYLICGVAAALSEGIINPRSTLPLIGASKVRFPVCSPPMC